MRRLSALKKSLDSLYNDYDFKVRIDKDPICLPKSFLKKEDVEVSALIAAALAYGRVGLFLPVSGELLRRMGDHPAACAASASPKELKGIARGLKYRFQRSSDLAAFIYCIGKTIRDFGSIEKAFMEGFKAEHNDIGPALASFIKYMKSIDTSDFHKNEKERAGFIQLLPSPATGGAAKRMCLFLRWMVRGSDIDLGLWKDIPKKRLVIPLDTHIMRVSGCLGLTKRKSPGWKTALEITDSLRQLDPDDPLKYDFALCHRGIQGLCGKDECENCDLEQFKGPRALL